MDHETLTLAMLELAGRLAAGAITRDEYDACERLDGEGERP